MAIQLSYAIIDNSLVSLNGGAPRAVVHRRLKNSRRTMTDNFITDSDLHAATVNS